VTRDLPTEQIAECKLVFSCFNYADMNLRDPRIETAVTDVRNSGKGIWLSHLVDVIKHLNAHMQLFVLGCYTLPPNYIVQNGLFAESSSFTLISQFW